MVGLRLQRLAHGLVLQLVVLTDPVGARGALRNTRTLVRRRLAHPLKLKALLLSSSLSTGISTAHPEHEG